MEQFDKNIEYKDSWPTVFGSSMLFLTALVLMFVSSFIFGGQQRSDGRYYLLLLLIQFFVIGVPPMIYMFVKGINIKETIRFNRISIPEVFLIVGMAFFGYIVIIAINLVWYWVLSKFGTPEPPPLPPIGTVKQYLMALVVIAIAPAVFEEFLFRGVIQRGYERISLTMSIVFTGSLFALLHISIVTLPSIILLGSLLCYVVYRSNSIWAGIIYHFINNAIAVSLTFLQSKLQDLFPLEDVADSIVEMPTETLMAGIIFWGFIGVFALLLFIGCFLGFYSLTKDRRKTLVQHESGKRVDMAELIPALAAGLVVIALLVIEFVEMVKGGSA